MVKNYIKNKNLDGLYDPSFEHDACGLGFVANIKGVKSHKIIQDGIKILENLEHRGATGADPLVGDGAGMLLQIPHEFFENECKSLRFQLPNEGNYGSNNNFTFAWEDDFNFFNDFIWEDNYSGTFNGNFCSSNYSYNYYSVNSYVV